MFTLLSRSLSSRRRKIRVVLTLLATICAVTKPATAYPCSGTVTQLSVGASGVVTVWGIGGLAAGYFCLLGATAPNGYTAEACRGAYDLLRQAQVTGQTVQVDFADSLSCTTQPAWGWMMGLY